MKIFIEIANRLKELRGSNSQKEFAEKVGIPFRTYQRYESGERAPKGNALQKIAEACNVPLNSIVLSQPLSKVTSPIGTRIREYRKSKSLKISNLAKTIGISQGSLSDIENQKTSPSSETIVSIVRNTDIRPEWLITGNGPMIKTPKELEKPDVAPVFQRLKKALSLSEDGELATELGIPVKILSQYCLMYNDMPFDHILKLCQQKGLNVHWVFTGEGSPLAKVEEKSDPLSEKILLLLRNMDEEKRREVLRDLEKEKLLNELLEERRKLKDAG